MYFSNLEFFYHLTHWILPLTLRGWVLCQRTCLLCASAGIKCQSQTLHFMGPAISVADKWCSGESGVGESWFRTVVKGRGKIRQWTLELREEASEGCCERSTPCAHSSVFLCSHSILLTSVKEHLFTLVMAVPRKSLWFFLFPIAVLLEVSGGMGRLCICKAFLHFPH